MCCYLVLMDFHRFSRNSSNAVLVAFFFTISEAPKSGIFFFDEGQPSSPKLRPVGQVGSGTLQAKVARPLPLLCPKATFRTYRCQGGQWHNPPERADDLEADTGAVGICRLSMTEFS